MFRKLQKHQPIQYTGIIQHISRWLVSGFEDLVYANPKYQALPQGETETAIVCIHGTADRVSGFKLIAERITSDLPSNISLVHLIAFTQRGTGRSIEVFSQQLENKILASGYKNVILMGHSRGGLVAAHFAEYHAAAANVNVEAVFTFGTPFAGSSLAMAPLSWVSSSVHEMEIGSQFLQALTAKMQESTRPYYPFAAENDILVRVDSTHLPQHQKSLVVLKRHGHVSMMSSHKLVDHLLARLQNPKKIPATDIVSAESAPASIELKQVCAAIARHIYSLECSYHLQTAAIKIALLQQLYGRLNAIAHGSRGDYYPAAQTIGQFIVAFMQDETLQVNNERPRITLNTALNYPISYFQYGNAASIDCMDGLIIKYSDTPLVVPPALAQLKTKI